MQITTVTQKGQATIPASVRKKFGLGPGSKIIFIEEKDEVKLKPAPNFLSFRGILKGRPYNKKLARKAIGEYLAKRHLRTLR